MQLAHSSTARAVNDSMDASLLDNQGRDDESQRRGGGEVEVNARKRKRSLSTSPPPNGSLGSCLPLPQPLQSPSSVPEPLASTNEPCSWFRGSIKSVSPEEAKEYALKIDQAPLRTPEVHRYVYWSDCSIVFRCAAGSVVWREPGTPDWQGAVYPYPHQTGDTGLVELFAIAHALEIAVRQITADKCAAFDASCPGSNGLGAGPNYQVLVFTDSIAALERLSMTSSTRHKYPTCWEQVSKCIKHHDELECLQASVEVNLIKGHDGVPGNVEADRRALALARRMQAQEISVPVAQISATVSITRKSQGKRTDLAQTPKVSATASATHKFWNTTTGNAQAERLKEWTEQHIPRRSHENVLSKKEAAESSRGMALSQRPALGTQKLEGTMTGLAQTQRAKEKTGKPHRTKPSRASTIQPIVRPVPRILPQCEMTTPGPMAQSLVTSVTATNRTIQSGNPIQSSKRKSRSPRAASKNQVGQSPNAIIMLTMPALPPSGALSTGGPSNAVLPIGEGPNGTLSTGEAPTGALPTREPSPTLPAGGTPHGALRTGDGPNDQDILRAPSIHNLPVRRALQVYTTTAPPSVPYFGFQYP